MFIDMVGYTKLMQENEPLAKEIRDRFRSNISEAVKNHLGNVAQYYGDGALCYFNSAIEAVKCAYAIQCELNKDPSIPARAGIHIGDIVLDDEGIFGDGVNVAARIEALSVPGSVLFSEKLNKELINHPVIKTTLLGYYELKNVTGPVKIFALNLNGIKVPRVSDIKSRSVEPEKTIAVLPFVNMSPDPENEYFSDGMTEEILNALAKIEGLRVTSRTSSFALKGKRIDIKEIGKQLGVKTILEGSVRKMGERVRITSQLINTADDYHIWSEVYDRKLEDIFKVQDEISSKIANTLKEKLTFGEKADVLINAPTQNLEVYNLYLKGSYNFFKWTPEGARKGIKYLEDAIKIEPDFALAYSFLAFCYTMLGGMGQSNIKEAFQNASDYADMAIELNKNLAEAHISKALIYLFRDYDIQSAGVSIRRALSLKSGDATVHHTYAMYLLTIRQFDEAIKELNKAVTLDPLSLPINQSLGEAYLFAKKYHEAIDRLNKALDLDPKFRPAIETKGWVLYFSGETEKSIEVFEELHNLTGDPLKGVTGLGYVYARGGRIDQAMECLKKLDERSSRDKNISLNMDYIVVYAGLKDYENVFKYLKKALDEGTGKFFYMLHPALEEVRNHPEFNNIIES